MRRRGISFLKVFEKMTTLSCDEVIQLLDSLGLPLCALELELVAASYAVRGRVSVEKMLVDLKKSPEQHHEEIENEDFSINLNKRLCILRSDKKRLFGWISFRSLNPSLNFFLVW